ncbi:MAG: WD40/YVTN/BNR-like repeat-containing protein [Gemmatimonadales bacterium]
MHRKLLIAGLTLATPLPGYATAQGSLETAVAPLEWRELGPAVTGGRIADIAAVESKPSVFYVGTASGGLWKTENHGASWTPLFDDQPTASIGDVTLAPSNPNIVWVGTGEPQNRQSSPWGNGVYRSTDAGRTWKHMGLEETRHIGRIVIHPTNPDIVFVAAAGHLWGPNPQRGIYRTRDGGATWKLVLYVDDNTGAIDLAMDPGDPNTLFAAMYQRRRTGFGFNGGGPGSGIYRTLDGGESWHELTEGLPEGDKGRIGLDVYRRDGNLVYAVVEADPRDPTRRRFGQPSGPRERKSGVFRSTDRGETWERMSETNPRPMYYSQIRIDPNNPERIYVLGTQLFVSDDGGKTFRDDGAATIHVDHHALWIDPSDSDHLLIGNDGGVAASFDGAATWHMYLNLAIGQFYQIGVDTRDPYYVCGGLQDNSSWCGPSRTFSRYGIRNGDWFDVWGGDGFYNLIDPDDPTILFTESQGGNLGRVDLTTGEGARIRPVPRPQPGENGEEREYRWNWNTPIVISSHNSSTIYMGANVLLRSRDRGQSWEEMSPDLTKQLDRKELEIMGVKGSEPVMSANDGISSYGNITSISESPLNAQVIYVGTDDGNVQVTRDGGATWSQVSSRISSLPERTYVSRLVASKHAEGRVYATFDGHRNDDYAAYAYVSEDFGQRWQRITKGLPQGWSVNVIAEHHGNPDLLFLGNEVGVYFSTDRGRQWTRLKNNLPTVPVDDIVIHPRTNDLVVGTHGRSIWILPDITPLEQLSPELLAADAHLFEVPDATMCSIRGGWPFLGPSYQAANPPVGAMIRYYLREDLEPAEPAVAEGGPGRRTRSERGAQDGEEEPKVELVITDARGERVRDLEGPTKAGIRQVVWDLRMNPAFEREEGEEGGSFFGPPRPPRVLPGTYTARLEVGGKTYTTEIAVHGDPRIEISDADRMARQEALLSLHTLAGPIHDATQAVGRLSRQLADVNGLLEEHGKAPETLSETVKHLRQDLDTLRQKLRQASRDARVANAIDGSTSRPTADQLWQIDRLWERVPGLIGQLNEIIETRLPELNRTLDEHGIRPSPGNPIELPKRPGG